MDRLNKIERLKDALHDTDYIAIKASEGCDVSDHGNWKVERQIIRDQINQIEQMTDEQFYENYPEEIESELENFESIEDYPDTDE